ncbi:MAG: ABC-F family ATP-binding cassette domain-containing protein, partial [Clostridia bacterium]
DRLSSGERMRVALARILLRGPDLIVLDEPTNHLDIAATMWLEEYLSAFTGGVFLISHDRYFLDRVATRIIELKNATTVVHHGNYSGFLQQQAIRKAFLESEKERLDHEIRSESALARKLRATAHITQAKSREKGIERLRVARVQVRASQTEGHLGKVNAVGLRLTHDAHISAEVAAARHAGKRFGERVLLEDANFLIRGGEHVAFVGANGCGKTTLLRMLLGQDDDHTGTCRLGSWVRVGLLDQNAEFIDEARTMLAEVIKQREQPEDTARTLLGKVGFYGDEIQKTIDKLSGGERVRLKLALLLQQAPQCLVLDEPTNHLDLPAREAVERAVADFRGTVLAVSHDRYFLNRCATRIIAFEGVHLVSYAGNWDVYQQTLAARMQPEIPAQQAVHAKHGESPAARAEDSSARIAEMEREIASLEAQMQQMTHRMMPDAPPSLYQDYEQASKQLEMLYEQWTKLG